MKICSLNPRSNLENLMDLNYIFLEERVNKTFSYNCTNAVNRKANTEDLQPIFSTRGNRAPQLMILNDVHTNKFMEGKNLLPLYLLALVSITFSCRDGYLWLLNFFIKKCSSKWIGGNILHQRAMHKRNFLRFVMAKLFKYRSSVITSACFINITSAAASFVTNVICGLL